MTGVAGGMKTFIESDFAHEAHLTGDDVTVYRKSDMSVIGRGKWKDGIIRGSGVNCGVLVRLEPGLREQSGTP